MENRNVLTVWSADEIKFFGYVLANYASSSKLKSPTDQLVFDKAEGRTLKAWIVAGRGSSHVFSSAPASTAVATRGEAGTAVAVR